MRRHPRPRIVYSVSVESGRSDSCSTTSGVLSRTQNARQLKAKWTSPSHRRFLVRLTCLLMSAISTLLLLPISPFKTTNVSHIRKPNTSPPVSARAFAQNVKYCDVGQLSLSISQLVPPCRPCRHLHVPQHLHLGHEISCWSLVHWYLDLVPCFSQFLAVCSVALPWLYP